MRIREGKKNELWSKYKSLVKVSYCYTGEQFPSQQFTQKGRLATALRHGNHVTNSFWNIDTTTAQPINIFYCHHYMHYVTTL